MSTPTIGVTGATGHIGGGVSRRLQEAGVAHRLLARGPERLDERVAAANGLLEAAALDFSDPEQAVTSVAGLDTVLLVSAAETAQREEQQLAMVDALARAGVRRVVYTSFAAPGPEATFTFARTHHATERAIEHAGLEHVFLRDNFYLDLLPHFAGEDRVLRGPADNGRVAAVARRDVVDCAAAVLTRTARGTGGTGGLRAAYTLTGPEALTLAEVARVLTRVTGRPYHYENETVEQARASRAVWDPEPWQLEAWLSTYTAIASGELAQVTEHVHELSGHAPRSLEDVLRGR